MKYLYTIILIFCLIIPVFAEKPITAESFVYHENSKSDIKEKNLITINITPFLSSGKTLDRKINEKELPLDQLVTNVVEHTNNGIKKIKYVQIYPESVLEMSDDAETVKQSSSGKVKDEIYYGYQKSVSQPWSQYYKIENCDDTKCRVVRADFATRQVWIEEILLTQANSIIGLPDYSALPSGVKL